jgi:hypothetical protein
MKSKKEEEIDKKLAELKEEFYKTPNGAAYKKHIDFFGVEPIHYYRRNRHNDKIRDAYLKAIEDGIPYDERPKDGKYYVG